MELLENVGLPNEIGFEIYKEVMDNLFYTKEDAEDYILELRKRCSKIYEKYELGNMNIKGDANICIKSYNGKKKIVTEKLCIINALYNYFDNSTYKYNGKIYFNQNSSETEEFYKNEIEELKKFISIKIEELKDVKTFSDIKNISQELYQNNMDAIKNIEPKTKQLLQVVLKGDIERLKRLKIWLKDFIDDLANVPNDDDLYKNIDQDKLRLYLVFQMFTLAPNIDEANGVLLAYNMVNTFNSIKNKDVSLSDDVYVLGANDNSEIIWKCYTNISYDSVKPLINNFTQNPTIKVILNTLKKFAIKNSDSTLNESYYEKIIDLVTKAII